MKKLKWICGVLSLLLIISLGYNFYSYSKITNDKEDALYRLTYNLQSFAGLKNDLDDPAIYAEKYGYITASQELSCVLNGRKGIPGEDWEYSVQALLLKMKMLMINDKEKFEKIFDSKDSVDLVWKISDNLEDRESINKLYKLITE